MIEEAVAAVKETEGQADELLRQAGRTAQSSEGSKGTGRGAKSPGSGGGPGAGGGPDG